LRDDDGEEQEDDRGQDAEATRHDQPFFNVVVVDVVVVKRESMRYNSSPDYKDTSRSRSRGERGFGMVWLNWLWSVLRSALT